MVDIRGWSDIVYALGPDPTSAAHLVDTFWTQSESFARSHRGEIYSWQGDALLVAFRGQEQHRVERALKTAVAIHAVIHPLEAECWELLRRAEAEAEANGSPNGRNVSRANQFAISSAITDGTAIAVPRGDEDRYCEELTGDCVNLAFAMVKKVPPNHVGISAEVYEKLKQSSSSSLDTFTWRAERKPHLAGTSRLIHIGFQTTPVPSPAQPPPGPGPLPVGCSADDRRRPATSPVNGEGTDVPVSVSDSRLSWREP